MSHVGDKSTRLHVQLMDSPSIEHPKTGIRRHSSSRGLTYQLHPDFKVRPAAELHATRLMLSFQFQVGQHLEHGDSELKTACPSCICSQAAKAFLSVKHKKHQKASTLSFTPSMPGLLPARWSKRTGWQSSLSIPYTFFFSSFHYNLQDIGRPGHN